MTNILIFLIVFVFQIGFTKPIQDKHRICKESKDCVLVGRGGCCNAGDAVNKKFFKRFDQPADEKCSSMLVECLKQKAVCENNICTIQEESFKSS